MKMFYMFFLTTVLSFDLSAQELEMDYCKMEAKAESEAIQEVCARYALKCSSRGGGAINVVRSAHFGVDAYRALTVSEARRIVVCSTLIFAKHINGCKPLRPFLIEYPFPMKELSVMLTSNKNLQDSSCNPDRLYYVSGSNGKLTYYESCAPNGKFKILFQESFNDALKIVQRDFPEEVKAVQQEIKDSKKSQSLASKVIDYFSSASTADEDQFRKAKYKTAQIDRDMRWNVDAYGTALAKKHGMIFHRAGNPTDFESAIYGLDIFDNHLKILEDGKMFIAPILRDFMNHLKTTDIILRYHLDHNMKFKTWKVFEPFTERPDPSQMCLKIGYWDENFDRPQAPYLAQILFVEGFCNYYVAESDTQALKLVFRESYDEAMKRLGVTDGKELKGT